MINLLIVLICDFCIGFVASNSQNAINDTKLQWLIFIGGHIKYASLDSLNKSLQLVYGVSKPKYEISDATSNQDGNDIIHWSSYNMYYDTPEMEPILDFYQNIHQVNHQLQKVNGSDTSTISTGNIVFCFIENDTLCIDSNTIGPTDNMLTSYGPIAMNTDFNLSNIVLIENWYNEYISIYVSMAVIHTSTSVYRDVISEIVENELFANSSLSKISILKSMQIDTDNDIYFKHVTYVISYDNLDSMYSDTGDPNDWKDKYGQFYYVPNNNKQMILYLCHMTAVCSNRDFCDEFLSDIVDHEKTDDDSDHETWMIVAIVFICLFVIALSGIVVIFWKSGKYNTCECMNGQNKSGYEQTETQ